MFKERDEAKRLTYKNEIKDLEDQNRICIYTDECGIQKDLVRQFGRSERGQRVYGQTTATRHAQTGIVSGYTRLPDQENYNYIAPWIFNCNCNTLVFNTWVEKILIPELKILQNCYPKYRLVVIMDNVSYHKSLETKELLAQAGIELKFQPPYSPDLNPIEPSWNTTKNEIRMQNEGTFLDKLCNTLRSRAWSSD